MITYKTTKDIDLEQLDNLFEIVGWGKRGIDKCKNIIDKSSFVISALDRNKLTGFGRIMEDGVMCMIYDFVVMPNYQGRHIGKEIFRKLVEFTNGKGYHSIGLFAWQDNLDFLIPFYEKFGFERSSGGMQLKRN